MPQDNPDTNTQNEKSQSDNAKNYLLTSKGDIIPIGNNKSAVPAGWANFVVIAGTGIVMSLALMVSLLIWYVAGGGIAFAGLLASGFGALSAIIGSFWQVFLGDIWNQLKRVTSQKRKGLFSSVIGVTFIIVLLAFSGTVYFHFDPYNHTGWPVLDSALSSNDNFWHSQTNTNNQASCHFTGEAYDITAVPNLVHSCTASSAVFDNFIYQIQMKFLQGECGGIAFRADPVNGKFYFFEVCRGPTRPTYCFTRYDALNKSQEILPCQSGNLTSILKNNLGRNQFITLAVVARGNNFELWVDKQELDVGFDITSQELKEGEIGVAAVGGATKTSPLTIIAFSNAKVWTFYGG